MKRFELIAALLDSGMSHEQVLAALVAALSDAQVAEEVEFIATQWDIKLP